MEKNRIVSIFLAAVLAIGLCLPAAAAGGTFSDVSPDAWYADAVDYAVENGLFSGTSSTTFSPTGDMTRGMFVTVLSRVADADTTSAAAAGFSDVKSGSWYEGPINWAAEKGYVGGVGDGKFAPDTPITREQIAVILRNYLTDIGAELGLVSNPTAFKDAAKVSSWAVDGVNYMRDTGLMAGDNAGNFNPKGNLSRAEAATVFMRLNQKLTGESGTTNEDDGKEPVAVLPGNIKVYEEAVSIEKAMETTTLDYKDTQARPGHSSEGLIPAGTNVKDDSIVEQQVYVNVSDSITGVLESKFYPSYNIRNISLTIYAYPTDTFTLDARAFGYTQTGSWDGNGSSDITINNVDGYCAEVTVNSSGRQTITFSNGKALYVELYSYERRPAEGETADFTMSTEKYEPVYRVSDDPNNQYNVMAWLTKKGETYNKDTAVFVDYEDMPMDNIRVYPTKGSNIPKSALTAEGYVEPDLISEYFDITTSEYNTAFLLVGSYLTIGLLPLHSADDNTIVTVTLTSKETGLSQSMDFTLIYAE